MSSVILDVGQAIQLGMAVLARHRTNEQNAASVIDALISGELDGQSGHGLSRLPSYAAQAASGKVDGNALPTATWVTQAMVRVDAANGFAYPALSLAIDAMAERGPQSGIVMAAIHRSHHCGMAGYHVERLAKRGMVGLMFANSPVAMAPWGGNKPLLGTNPIAFAAPRRNGEPLVIDLSLSKVARGKIMVAARNDKPIPEGWALNAAGQPTTDPKAALEGSMVPMGDAKGAALALMVEILAAAVPGAALAFEASSFFTADGPPSGVGQLLIGFYPGPLSGDAFPERLETLLSAITGQPGTRLPGDRRLALRAQTREQGISLPDSLFRELTDLAQA
jgi:(2R)-3-sulfolactate dehydrogenase (NADP+)